MRKYLTSVSGADQRRYYSAGEWQATTLLDLARQRAESAPDSLAVADSRRRLTNTEFVRAVATMAGLLRERGVVAGDPVVIQLRNEVAYPIAQIAINAVGAVFVAVPTSTSPSAIAAVAERVGAVTLVTSAELASRTSDEAPPLPVVVDVAELWDRFDKGQVGWNVEESLADPDEPVNILFSSGTTGLPKGIINTTNTQLAAVRHFVSEIGFGAEDAWLVVPPMAHNAGWLYSFMPAFVAGASAVLQERFDPTQTLELLAREKIRAVFLTPTHASDVLSALDVASDHPTTVRHILIGGAATPQQMKQQLRERLGANVVSIYGATENQAATYTRPGADPEHADLTVGWPCPSTEVAIIGDDRRTLMPANTVGEIATRGPGTFAGYFADQAATDAAFNRDGWFLTGDLGVLDEQGALRIAGRRKELIIRGGHNIAPEDVENALDGHPLLSRVAAVGIPDARLGEIVCAVVIADRDVELVELTAFLSERGVSKYLWPEAVFRVAEFPLTDIGKVQRRRLATLAAEAANKGTIESNAAKARV